MFRIAGTRKFGIIDSIFGHPKTLQSVCSIQQLSIVPEETGSAALHIVESANENTLVLPEQIIKKVQLFQISDDRHLDENYFE